MKAFYESRTYNSEIPVSVGTIKDFDFVAHWHTDIEMVYVYEGSLGVGISSEYRILEAGDFCVCGSNDIHYYESEGMTSTAILFIFRPELLDAFRHWSASLKPGSIFICRDTGVSEKAADTLTEQIGAIFTSINNEMRKKEGFYPLFTDLRITELFLTLFRHLPSYYADSIRKTDGLQSAADTKPMQKALKYLEENYTQDISLEQISSEVNLSRFYFSRLFRKTTGMNFNMYLNRLRADKAEELIRSTKKPIIEIAYETGFLSVRTFNRTFMAIKGFAPHILRHGQIR